MEKSNDTVDQKYAKFLKMRHLGIRDEAVRQAMILSGLTKDGDALAVFGAHEPAVTPDVTTRARSVDLNESLLIYYSKETHLSGETHFSDPLLAAMFRSWDARSAGPPPEEEGTCQICFESVAESQLIRTCQLGVPYCKGCVVSFLEGDIREARVTENGCDCLCRSCNANFSEEAIGQLVDTDTLQKFIKFRNAKLVQNNPLKVYCPSPTCSSVVTLSAEGATRAKCQTCKMKFCVKCGDKHSRIVTCEWAADSGFRKWKGSTPDGCKRCPNCRLFIEKNGGCSHMTCQHCHHGFCWLCMSPWTGGCSAGKFCVHLRIIRSDIWGPVPVLRETAQVVGITAGVSVGLGLAAAAVGVAAAAGAVVIGVGIPVAVVGGPMYGAYRGAKTLKKHYLRKQRMRAMGNGTNIVRDDDDATDLRNELKWGIRVFCSARSLVNRGLSRDENSFMGMSGRMVEGIFIAYPDFGGRLNGSSPPLYIIPSRGVTEDVINRVAGWPMVQVHVNALSANQLLNDIASSVLAQFDHSKGYASIRFLPNYRSDNTRKSASDDDSFYLSPGQEYRTMSLSAPPIEVADSPYVAEDIVALRIPRRGRTISY